MHFVENTSEVDKHSQFLINNFKKFLILKLQPIILFLFHLLMSKLNDVILLLDGEEEEDISKIGHFLSNDSLQ